MSKKFLLVLAVLVLPFMAKAQDLKLGYVNSSTLMQSMPELDSIEKKMATFNEQNQKYLQDMQSEIQTKMDSYQASKDSLDESIQKVKEQELQDLYQRYQNAQQTLYSEAQKKQAALLQPVKDKLKAAIETVGKKNNFYFIFDTASGGILYSSPKAVDVTSLVKKELGIL